MTAARLGARASPGACLDDLLSSRFLSRGWAARIWAAGDLPARLERCARSLEENCEWRGYRDGDDERVFFAIAQAHRAPSRGSGLAIKMYLLDAAALVYSAGVWEHDEARGWWLDSVLDASYDCDHGWWLGQVLGDNALGELGFDPPARRIAVRRSSIAAANPDDFRAARPAPKLRTARK